MFCYKCLRSTTPHSMEHTKNIGPLRGRTRIGICRIPSHLPCHQSHRWGCSLNKGNRCHAQRGSWMRLKVRKGVVKIAKKEWTWYKESLLYLHDSEVRSRVGREGESLPSRVSGVRPTSPLLPPCGSQEGRDLTWTDATFLVRTFLPVLYDDEINVGCMIQTQIYSSYSKQACFTQNRNFKETLLKTST